jgi:hypothetical protein
MIIMTLNEKQQRLSISVPNELLMKEGLDGMFTMQWSTQGIPENEFLGFEVNNNGSC